MSKHHFLSQFEKCSNCSKALMFRLKPKGGRIKWLLQYLKNPKKYSFVFVCTCGQEYVCDKDVFGKAQLTIAAVSVAMVLLYAGITAYYKFWSDELFVVFLLSYTGVVFLMCGRVKCLLPQEK